MRIAFLTHRLPYAPNRGDRIRAYHLLRALAAKHEVHLVSLVHDADEESHLADLSGHVKSVVGVAVPRLQNYATALTTLFSTRPLTHALLQGPGMAHALNRLIRDHRPQMVLAYCTGMARFAMEAPLDSLPFLLDMVDVDSAKWASLAETSQGPMRYVYRREARCLGAFEQQAMKAAVATFVISERERGLLNGCDTERRVVVVPNGVDVSSYAPPPDRDKKRLCRVIFCGVFDYEPNEAGARWLASEVWPLVKQAVPHAQLDLVGMNPTRAVSALHAPSSIRVTGAVPDVRPYLWDAAVSAAPLSVARGVQNKVLEAVAAGLPAVVTPQVYEGLPAGVRPACVVASDAGGFAQALITLLDTDDANRQALVANADLGTLSWEQQLAPILAVLAGLAGSVQES